MNRTKTYAVFYRGQSAGELSCFENGIKHWKWLINGKRHYFDTDATEADIIAHIAKVYHDDGSEIHFVED